MASAISNTSPLLYLYRIQALHMLPHLFDSVITPPAVVNELDEGRRKGFDVPNPLDYPWLEIRQPAALPSEWLALDLGAGELAAMTLALEMPGHIVLRDDMLARRTAHAAGLTVWGTLCILLEMKARGLLTRIEPSVDQLSDAGLWMTADIRQRILALAGEHPSPADSR